MKRTKEVPVFIEQSLCRSGDIFELEQESSEESIEVDWEFYVYLGLYFTNIPAALLSADSYDVLMTDGCEDE